MLVRPLFLVVASLCLLTAPARAVVIFSEDFSDNSAGWSLSAEWQIGPTSGSSGQSGGTFPDPSADHTPTADNGVAGTILGGNISTSIHASYAIESPAINLSSQSGTVLLRFWRWLNLDYPPFMTGRVEVWNGGTWITLFESPAASSPIADNAWTQFTYDVTAYKNANFRVRFTHQVGSSGAFTVSGWNIDDLELATPCSDDADGDTFISVACGGDDCDDTNPAIHPGALDICGNGIDEDCDGLFDETTTSYPDADGDGFGWYAGAMDSCGVRSGYVLNSGDCNDSNAGVHPGATELCNGLDDNCDGNLDEGFALTEFYQDYDGDGFGNSPVMACVAPPGYVAIPGDCDDSDPSVHPGGIEVCNGKDDDCDGEYDEGLTAQFYYDFDYDGYGSPFYPVQACSLQAGLSTNALDCDDFQPSVHPGAPEICDGRDNDCDGSIDEDCAYLTFESIKDVKNDQGRNVRLTWVRSAKDTTGQTYPVTSYSVWRRIDGDLAAAKAARVRDAGAPLAWEALARTGETIAQGTIDPAAGPGRPEVNDLPPGYWDFIAWVPSVHAQRYRLVSPTLCDSNAAGLCWSTFFVRAHAESGDEDSPPDSGYSVDNIVPGVPQGLTATLVTGGHHLNWNDSSAPDFQYYRVYRGTDPAFLPGPGNLVHSTATSEWTDPSLGSYLYKVTTLDANGNESAPAATPLVTGVEDETGAALAFASISPNPFRGELSCAILVPSSGADVTLRVIDLAGRTVRTLASSRLAPGRHALTWDGRDAGGRRVAPGVYLLRLAGGGVSSVRRVAFTP